MTAADRGRAALHEIAKAERVASIGAALDRVAGRMAAEAPAADLPMDLNSAEKLLTSYFNGPDPDAIFDDAAVAAWRTLDSANRAMSRHSTRD